MKKNKLLIVLLIALGISIGVYLWLQKKNKEKFSVAATPKDAAPAGDNQPPANPAHDTPRTLPPGHFPLKKGSKGKAVQMLQVIVGVKPDSVWGEATDLAVKRAALPEYNGQIYASQFLGYTTGLGKAPSATWPLSTGSAGNYVKAVQIMLGQKIDGKFGPGTAAAVRSVLGHGTVTDTEFLQLIKDKILS
jgi:peptidoglycan hydrolase-like protein with peptidoglycan-binding domain